MHHDFLHCTFIILAAFIITSIRISEYLFGYTFYGCLETSMHIMNIYRFAFLKIQAFIFPRLMWSSCSPDVQLHPRDQYRYIAIRQASPQHPSWKNLEKHVFSETPRFRSPGVRHFSTISQVDGCYRKWRPRKGLELILRGPSGPSWRCVISWQCHQNGSALPFWGWMTESCGGFLLTWKLKVTSFEKESEVVFSNWRIDQHGEEVTTISRHPRCFEICSICRPSLKIHEDEFSLSIKYCNLVGPKCFI